MKTPRFARMFGALALLGLAGWTATAEVRRDPLVGPHPNAWQEEERPRTGLDRLGRAIETRSPRERANAVRPSDGVTADRLSRRTRVGSPRGAESWGNTRN